jgi:hypothetical protein
MIFCDENISTLVVQQFLFFSFLYFYIKGYCYIENTFFSLKHSTKSLKVILSLFSFLILIYGEECFW